MSHEHRDSAMAGSPLLALGFMYGTAWKEDDTRRLTRLALEAGFRAIDTANQRKHYYEAGVGQALAGAFAAGLLARDDVFVQTKFTYRRGQDHRLPYQADADFATQVQQSFKSSLEHLGVDTIDSYVLHGPWTGVGLADADWQVWRAMEALHDAGKVGVLGLSNASREQVQALCDGARVAPAFVQNRCYASQGWDREVRALCRERGIVYQGFSLLTANRRELESRAIQTLAARVGKTPAQIAFRFAQQVGMLPLTGTSSPEHMREDLAIDDFELSAAELRMIEDIGIFRGISRRVSPGAS